MLGFGCLAERVMHLRHRHVGLAFDCVLLWCAAQPIVCALVDPLTKPPAWYDAGIPWWLALPPPAERTKFYAKSKPLVGSRALPIHPDQHTTLLRAGVFAWRASVENHFNPKRGCLLTPNKFRRQICPNARRWIILRACLILSPAQIYFRRRPPLVSISDIATSQRLQPSATTRHSSNTN